MSKMTSWPRGPVILVHLEDPPGSGFAACSGIPFEPEPHGQYANVPRVACPGCVGPIAWTPEQFRAARGAQLARAIERGA